MCITYNAEAELVVKLPVSVLHLLYIAVYTIVRLMTVAASIASGLTDAELLTIHVATVSHAMDRL